MKEKQRKYFIGFALSGRQKEAVDALRQRISDEFGVKGTLTSPPHITLFAPFHSDAAAKIASGLERLAADARPFDLPIKGFGAFDNAVWYLDPAQHAGLLALRNAVRAALADAGIEERPERRDPHFHITLAYKDVSPATHERIGEFLRRETLPIDSVLVDNVTLFERDADDTRWISLHTFRFALEPTK